MRAIVAVVIGLMIHSVSSAQSQGHLVYQGAPSATLWSVETLGSDGQLMFGGTSRRDSMALAGSHELSR